MSQPEHQLLSITKTAQILGIHPLTLRNWAEKGQVPCYRTPGGHRRFKLSEVLSVLNRTDAGQAEDSGLALVARQAVRQAIKNPPDPQSIPPFIPEGVELSEQQRASMRSVGRSLLGLTIQYAAGTADETVLDEARQIGQTYGEFTRSIGMPISRIVSTFNFFRDTIIQVTFEAVAGNGTVETSNPQLYRRLSSLFNQVLLATVEAAEKSPGEQLKNSGR